MPKPVPVAIMPRAGLGIECGRNLSYKWHAGRQGVFCKSTPPATALFRRFDRWLATRLLNRRYEFILPGAIRR